MKMKLLSIVAGLVGLTAVIALIIHEGYHSILQLLGLAGWSLLWLIPFHVLPLLLDAEGWRVLLRPSDPQRHASLPFLWWIATIREAVSRLLPVASVGGEIIGIRLALLRPLPGPAVTASVVIEVLLTLVNQFLFTALGLALLVTLLHSSDTADALIIGLVVSLPVPVALYLLLRHGSLFARMEHAILAMLGGASRLKQLLGNAAALDQELRKLFAQTGRLVQSLCWQQAGMVLGSFETWLILWLLGHPVNAWEALTLESLTLAVRHFIFFVPGGIGVQEAGMVLFGSLIGLPADLAVALSLAKRAREIGFGVPALLSWQWVEGRRLRQTLRQQTPDER